MEIEPGTVLTRDHGHYREFLFDLAEAAEVIEKLLDQSVTTFRAPYAVTIALDTEEGVGQVALWNFDPEVNGAPDLATAYELATTYVTVTNQAGELFDMVTVGLALPGYVLASEQIATKALTEA